MAFELYCASGTQARHVAGPRRNERTAGAEIHPAWVTVTDCSLLVIVGRASQDAPLLFTHDANERAVEDQRGIWPRPYP
ncbi:hypothetical protein RB195_011166 [Necator americanus]|uniref:Sema domain-containing protein n=1 Tax=Necator americanus TaxID=51031 RepID=A0ABR1D273_NECAM